MTRFPANWNQLKHNQRYSMDMKQVIYTNKQSSTKSMTKRNLNPNNMKHSQASKLSNNKHQWPNSGDVKAYVNIQVTQHDRLVVSGDVRDIGSKFLNEEQQVCQGSTQEASDQGVTAWGYRYAVKSYGIAPDEFGLTRHSWSRRWCDSTLVIGKSRFVLTYFSILGLRKLCTCALGDFDTARYALVEDYIDATNE